MNAQLKLVVVVVLALVCGLVMPVHAADCDGALVDIPDANLEAAVRGALGLGTNDPISTTQMCLLDGLNAASRGITDLTGLETAVNLQILDISDNNVADLSPIAELPNLSNLYMGDNEVSDLSPLADLPLTYLNAGNNLIVDASGLGSVTTLTTLLLPGNQISDSGFLTNLFNLTQLNVAFNRLTEIAGIANDTQITNLEIHHNLIDDLTPLSNLGSLLILRAANNAFSDLQPLQILSGIAVLDIQNNPVRNLFGILGSGVLQSGESVMVSGCPLDAISACVVLSHWRNIANVFVTADQECVAAAAHDTCATATPVGLGEYAWGGVFEATDEGVNVSCATGDNRDVWHVFTPDATANYRVDLSGSNFDSSLSVFGECGGAQVACDDNSGEDNASALNFPMTGGEDYYIRVGGPDADSGYFSLVVTIAGCGADDAVTFADANLEAALRSELGIPTGDILESDLCPVASLDLSARGIVNLSGLEAAENLQSLDISGNLVVNTAPIESLSNLVTLKANSTNITNLSFLASLGNLRVLELRNNGITNTSGLAALTGLEELYVSGNNLSSLGTISGLTALTHLE